MPIETTKLAVRVPATAEEEAALRTIGGATVIRDFTLTTSPDGNDVRIDEPTVVVEMSWPTDTAGYEQEARLLIEAALTQATPAPPPIDLGDLGAAA